MYKDLRDALADKMVSTNNTDSQDNEELSGPGM